MGAEVGVLELQIHDNSAKAASGLGNLASALTRVQKALGSGLRLGNTANQIGKIVEKMQSAIPEESVSRIERLANAMEKLSAAGKISIPSLKGLKVDSVKEATKAAKENDPFEATASTVETINAAQEQAVEKIVEQKQAARETQEAIKEVAESAEKAAEETGNLSDAMEPAKQAVQETKEEAKQLKEELQGASQAAQSIKASSGFWKQYNPATGQFEEMEGIRNASDWSKAYDEEVKRAAEEHDRLRKIAEGIGRFREELDKPIDWGNLSGGIDRMLGIGGEVKSAAESASVFMSNMEQVDAVEQTMESAGAKTESLKDKLKALASDGLQRVKSDLKGMKASLHNMIAPLDGFANQLARVAKYRMLRGIIKQISEGFKEGVENYYFYSKAINNGFSAAMDRAATSLQTFKNSIGAAVAPVIEALIPILQKVVTWVVTAINYVNQFLSLLAGKKSWSMAVDTTAKAFDNTKKSAGGATKAIKGTDNAVKDLLADFDELNIIQSQTDNNGGSGTGGSGGGTGKTATNYKKMFQENFAFNNDLLAFVENLKDRFSDVEKTVATIGAALLGWAFSSSFSGLLGTLGAIIAAGSIIKLTFDVVSALDNTFFDTGHDEWLLMDVLATMIGAGLAEKVVTMAAGKAIGQYMVPLTLLFSAAATISAIIENKDLTALDARTIKAALVGALKAGAAFGLIAKNALGMTAFDAVLTGAAGALITFGVTIGLKAIMDTIETGEITIDTIKADLLAALTTGAGIGLVYYEFSELPFLRSMGVGAGAALMTFGVLIGIQGVIKVLEDGKITASSLLAIIGGSALLGAGLAIAEISAGGTVKEAIALGGTAALLTMGVLVGLSAIVEVANDGKITAKTLLAEIAGSALLGAGIVVSEISKGASTVTALTKGGSVALLSLGVLVGISAIIEVANDGKITEKTLLEDIGSSVLIGSGLVLSEIARGTGTVQAITRGGSAALITMGVLVGIESVIEVAESGKITENTILEDIGSSALIGVGLGLAEVTHGGTVVSALAKGGVGALLTFGVLIGAQAVLEVAKNGEINETTILKDLTSAAFVGAGLGLATVTLAGGSVATALAIGGVGALFTFGVLCTVQAILTADKEEPIKWGEEKFTQEEIEAFVGELFTVEPSVTVSLLNSKVEISKESKDNLRTSVENTLEKLEVLKVGLDDENSLKELEDAVFNNEDSLMNKFKTFAEGQRTLVATTLQFAIIEDENGNNEAGTIATEINNGWKDLENVMTGLGNDLTAAFKTAYDKSIDKETRNAAKETIAKLTQMMADISAAVSYGQSKAKAMTGFTEMAKGMSQETASQVIEYYRQMKDEMIAAETQALQETAESALALSYAYQYLADKAETEEERSNYQTKSDSFKARYGQLIENAESSATDYVNTELQNDEKVKAVRDSLLGNITEEGWGRTRLAVVENSIMWNSLVSDLFTPDGQVVENAKDTLQGSFVTILQKAWGDKNANTYIDAVKSGFMGWKDVIKPEVIQALEDMMDLDQESDEIKQAWADLIKEVFGEGTESSVTLPEVEAEQPIELVPEITNGDTSYEVDTETTGKTSGANWATRAMQTARAAAYGYTGDNSVWTNGQRVRDDGYGQEGMQGGLDEAAFTIQTDLQTGMANRQSDIQSGVQAGTGSLLTALNSILAVAHAINSKDFTVNIVPSTTLGEVNKQSGRRLGRVTGNMEAP